jgi:hypothetical protein
LREDGYLVIKTGASVIRQNTWIITLGLMRTLAKVVAWLALVGLLYLVVGTLLGTTLRLLFEQDPMDREKERFAAQCGPQSKLEKWECARTRCEIELRERELLPRDVVAVEWTTFPTVSDTPARSDHVAKFKAAGDERFAKCEMKNSDVVAASAAAASEFDPSSPMRPNISFQRRRPLGRG